VFCDIIERNTKSAKNKMPVGCLSGGRSVGDADSTLYLNSDGMGPNQESGSDASRQADQMAVMQQTLLVQIFRIPQDEGNILSCQTCSTFSSSCCQTESGWSALACLVEANSKAVWNLPLVRAVNSLCFQGYVCPGILVTSTEDTHLAVLEQCWKHHTLISPPGYKIFRLGLSGGCVVTPLNQGPSPSLPDAICAVLWDLKTSERVANMENVINGLKQIINQFRCRETLLT